MAVESVAGAVPCVGHGTSGKRLEAIYAYPISLGSRYAAMQPYIQQYAGIADAIVDASAAETNGSRHLRWLHDANCDPIVRQVGVSDAAALDFDDMISELYVDGYNRVDRKYVVWMDVSGVYCGIAMTTIDERTSSNNLHNGDPSTMDFGLFARIDLPCWGSATDTFVEAHEITHTLGAVQPHAPHSSSVVYSDGSVDFYGHCTDEYDIMCYADGTPKSLTHPCGASHERLLDCRHDDYFSTAPGSTNYLHNHWNTAMNAFLIRTDPIAGFIDILSPTFRSDIAWLADSGITKGCTTDGERFCPLDEVTRGQMAAFLVRALHLPSATGPDSFSDDNGTTFEHDINALAASDITRGCTATHFCPLAEVTRGQMAAFLVRALHLPSATGADPFSDDNGTTFEHDINALYQAGITTGCSATSFCAGDAVTRGQMAAFLHRALE